MLWRHWVRLMIGVAMITAVPVETMAGCPVNSSCNALVGTLQVDSSAKFFGNVGIGTAVPLTALHVPATGSVINTLKTHGPFNQTVSAYVAPDTAANGFHWSFVAEIDAGSSTPGDKVAVYGGARSGSGGSNIWGGNFLATQDAADPRTNVQGIEVDVNSDKEPYVLGIPKVMIGTSIISGGAYGAGWGLHVGSSRTDNKWLDGIRIDPVRRVGLEIDWPMQVFTANIATRQPANGSDSIVIQRQTDTSPSGFFLRTVNAANSQNLFWITHDGGIFANGNVGIGTGAPTAKLHVVGNFVATGLKSAIVDTKTYGRRELYAVESSGSWFEDFGASRLKSGEINIPIDPMFSETVNTGVEYHVFITPNGPCNLYIASKDTRHFTVRASSGEEDCAFDYRIVAKRSGYENVRLASHPADRVAVK